MNHPSALSMFEQIVNASKGKQIVMFLDYDGTLSPIVEDPDRAFMTNEVRFYSSLLLTLVLILFKTFLSSTLIISSFLVSISSDERGCEGRCKIFSYSYSDRKVQGQGKSSHFSS